MPLVQAQASFVIDHPVNSTYAFIATPANRAVVDPFAVKVEGAGSDGLAYAGLRFKETISMPSSDEITKSAPGCNSTTFKTKSAVDCNSSTFRAKACNSIAENENSGPQLQVQWEVRKAILNEFVQFQYEPGFIQKPFYEVTVAYMFEAVGSNKTKVTRMMASWIANEGDLAIFAHVGDDELQHQYLVSIKETMDWKLYGMPKDVQKDALPAMEAGLVV